MINRPAASSKVLLIADRRVGSSDVAPAVRRFRLARLRLDGRPEAGLARAGLTESR
ncbi:MAG TPA: hypothetical protein VGL51_10410 [Solirubrobacteraceae bacterium]